jgi:hypothetical protein
VARGRELGLRVHPHARTSNAIGQREGHERENNENPTSDSARTTPSTHPGLSVLLGARTILRGTSGYVLRLGSLVNSRRSLYQSKPSIEAPKANTAPAKCNLDNRPD